LHADSKNSILFYLYCHLPVPPPSVGLELHQESPIAAEIITTLTLYYNFCHVNETYLSGITCMLLYGHQDGFIVKVGVFILLDMHGYGLLYGN
jgi:hypothetical protein